MRSLALLLFAATAACHGGEHPSSRTVAPPASPADRREQTLTAYLEGLNGHDAQKLAALFTDNATLHAVGAPRGSVGHEKIVASYQTLWSTFHDYKTAAHRVFLKDDVAIVERTFHATADGRDLGTSGLDILWLDPEGRIKDLHAYRDERGVAAQLGLLKGTPPPVPPLPEKTEMVRWHEGAPAFVPLTAAPAFDDHQQRTSNDWTFGRVSITETIVVDPAWGPALESVSLSEVDENGHRLSGWGYTTNERANALADALGSHRPGADLKPVAAKSEPNSTKLMQDGFSCTPRGHTPYKNHRSEHCFVCPNEASMEKCSAGPIAAGCKEVATCKVLK